MGAVKAHAILHVDMDAFYTSIEERERPQLAGKPVVVGGTPEGRGVVAAANYEARKYGIHSAMPAARARRLCPHAVFLPARHDYYAKVSQQIRVIFQRYTPLVEPLSLDEAFLDVSASRKLFGPAAMIGRYIKRDIVKELGLVASVGVAPNKFVAKIASDLQKPDGFVVVEAPQVQLFLDPLPVSRVWGVGKVACARLQGLGVNTIGELRRVPLARLQELFGHNAEHLRKLAHGIDERAVIPDQQAKVLSCETTFERDIVERETLRAWLLELTQQVAWRLRRQGLQARTVHIKIRLGDFRTLTRAHTLPEATAITRELWQAGQALLEKGLNAAAAGVRLLGIGVSGLEVLAAGQGRLFDQAERERYSRLDDLSDRVRARFGARALRRAGEFRHSD
jgi:DNA polymerase-4